MLIVYNTSHIIKIPTCPMKIVESKPVTTETELRLEPRVSESYYSPDMDDRTVDGVVELMTGLQESM